MDIRSSAAAQIYANAQKATSPQTQDLGKTAGSALGNFAESLRQNEQVAQAAMTGVADPHALVQALAQTELAVETAVTVRNKVVEAYQEILRMPV